MDLELFVFFDQRSVIHLGIVISKFDFEHSSMIYLRGFGTLRLLRSEGGELDESDLSKWFLRNQLDTNLGKVIVKPTKAGSSIGITVAYGVTNSLRKANEIISELMLALPS